MTSVFKKLISKELGENKYNKYFFSYQKKIADKTYSHKELENKEIYDDIYEVLKDKDEESIQKMVERLGDTMCFALRISKTYVFIFLTYLIAAIFLIAKNLMPSITIVSLILISVCFIYKTYEFVVNKFCFIDAHIILIYKSVLDKIILSRYEKMKE